MAAVDIRHQGMHPQPASSGITPGPSVCLPDPLGRCGINAKVMNKNDLLKRPAAPLGHQSLSFYLFIFYFLFRMNYECVGGAWPDCPNSLILEKLFWALKRLSLHPKFQ